MRVIAGTARGCKINSIDDLSTRPTLDRVKESLFSIIQNYIKDANVLDLFAGSGALGIEALSRGAKHCIFCDKSYKAIQMVKININKTKMKEKSTIINKDYKKCLEQLKDVFDIIFIDPPYRKDIAIKSISQIIEKSLLSKSGIIILETDEEQREIKELKNVTDLEVYDERKYGRVKLLFLRRKGWIMEIFTLLETLEEMLENSKTIPIVNKGLIDKEEMLEIIKEIRLKLPDELKQAKWVKEERQRILVEAQKEADDIVKEAENRIISMIDEHEITRKAYEQKAEIIETANEMSREISKGTKDYADSILSNIETALQNALETIQNNRRELK